MGSDRRGWDEGHTAVSAAEAQSRPVACFSEVAFPVSPVQFSDDGLCVPELPTGLPEIARLLSGTNVLPSASSFAWQLSSIQAPCSI